MNPIIATIRALNLNSNLHTHLVVPHSKGNKYVSMGDSDSEEMRKFISGNCSKADGDVPSEFYKDMSS